MKIFTIDDIALVCYQANRAWCETIGDSSQFDWKYAPDWQKQSVIDGVSFHLETPDATDADSHNAWLKYKQAEGWQWGEKKDPEAKRHPQMVSFEDLPSEQQVKDRLFRFIVHALSPMLEVS